MLVAFYFVTQILTALGIVLLPLGLGIHGGSLAVVGFETNFADAFVGEGNDDVMPLGFLPVLLLVSAVCLWCTHYSWNRKVSLV